MKRKAEKAARKSLHDPKNSKREMTKKESGLVMRGKPMGRLLTITDIHGCANTLKSLIENKLKPVEGDKLICLGDYVDRGDKIFEVVEYLIELSKTVDCVFLKGNHEDMWIRYLKSTMRLEEVMMFYQNGGKSTVDSYCANIIDEDDGKPMRPGNGINWDDLPQTHKDFYDSLKLYHEEDDFVFVHAGIRPGFSLEDQEAHDLMWIREQFLYHPTQVLSGKTIVHGHTPMERYELVKYNEKYSDRINLDSGCVFGVFLTGMDVRTGFKSQQKCIDTRTS